MSHLKYQWFCRFTHTVYNWSLWKTTGLIYSNYYDISEVFLFDPALDIIPVDHSILIRYLVCPNLARYLLYSALPSELCRIVFISEDIVENIQCIYGNHCNSIVAKSWILVPIRHLVVCRNWELGTILYCCTDIDVTFKRYTVLHWRIAKINYRLTSQTENSYIQAKPDEWNLPLPLYVQRMLTCLMSMSQFLSVSVTGLKGTSWGTYQASAGKRKVGDTTWSCYVIVTE